MRISRIAIAFAAAALIAVAGQPVAAQSGTTATVTISTTVPTVLSMDLSGLSLSFPTPSATDFNAGFINAASGVTVTHRGNVQHAVTLRASSAQIVGSTDPVGNIKPISDLQFSSGSSYSALTTADQDVVTNAVRGIATASLTFRLLLNYRTDGPDSYSVPVVFTIVPR